MSTDFRIAKRDSALAKAANLQARSDAGGDAWDTPDNFSQRAASAQRFADWVQAKIEANPLY